MKVIMGKVINKDFFSMHPIILFVTQRANLFNKDPDYNRLWAKIHLTSNPRPMLKWNLWNFPRCGTKEGISYLMVRSRRYFRLCKRVEAVFRVWRFVTTVTTVAAFVKTSWWLHNNRRSASWQHLGPSVWWSSLLLFLLTTPSLLSASSNCIQGVLLVE